MANEVQVSAYRGKGLAPFQARLVAEVLADPVPARHLLVADPGTGKTYTALFLAKEVAGTNPQHRILIVGPRTLATMYEYELSRLFPSTEILVADRRRLRDLEAQAKIGSTIWPAPVVVVIGMDTARQEDVLGQLSSTTWDFVILEEVQVYGRSRWTLLKTILRDQCFRRVLMLTGTPELKGIASLIKQAKRTEWMRGTQLKDWDGKQLFATPRVNLRAFLYRRTDPEISLLRALMNLVGHLGQNAIGQLVRKTLLKQASSSLFALEQTIRGLRNSLVHGVSDFLPEPGLEGFEEGDDSISTLAGTRAVWENKAAALVGLTSLITMFESLTTDSKRDALESLLGQAQRDIAGGALAACIFCTAKATASYLKTAFSPTYKTWLLTSEISPAGIETSLSGFTSHGGLLVCTPMALKGIELRRATTLVHYDPPGSVAEMSMRLSRNPQAPHFFLKDESNTLPDEWAFVERPDPTSGI